MASVGGVLQDAMQMAARRRQEGQGRDQGDTEVDVEVETEEAGLMQTTLSSSWYTLLHQLRTYLAMPRAVQGSLWPCSPPPWLTCARECTTWILEWWARLEPHLPISTGSACCRRAVPREDPVPIFLGRTVPDNASAGEESVDASTLAAPRGPPPPQPVRPLLSQSPTDEDLLLAAEAME